MGRIVGAALLLILSFQLTFAQQWCGTHADEAGVEQFFKLKTQLASLRTAPTGTEWIPIKMHLIGMDDSTGFHPHRTTLDIMCELNDWFATVGVQFYLYEGINYIAKSEYYDFTNGGLINQIFREYNVGAEVIDVYITNTPTDGLCGRSAFTWSGLPHGIIQKKTCSMQGGTTFPHEMGHYLNLLHTFSSHGSKNLNKHEFVTRIDTLRNCEKAGDGFCDTEADYLSERWECLGAVHTQKDRMDTVYRPDETLIMSYAADHCVDKFSPEQEAHMYYTAKHLRAELLNHPPPVKPFINGTLKHVAPAHNESDVPANYVMFRWKSVKGAKSYHLKCTRFSLNSDIKLAVDVIVNDTFYLAKNHDFEEFKNYDWIVRPFNESNTCAGYSTFTSFNTGFTMDLTGIDEQKESIKLTVTPANGKLMIHTEEVIDDLTLLGLDGKVLGTFKKPGKIIDLPNLPAGLYFVRAIANEKAVNQKFIITY
jgi:hypothetical protein